MQVVELVAGEMVDHPQDVVDPEEVAGHVEHGAPVRKAWPVGDRSTGQRPGGADRSAALDRGREELAQGLDAVVEPGRRGGTDPDAGRRDVESVALGAEVGLLHEDERDVVGQLGVLRFGDREPISGGRPEQVGEAFGDGPRVGFGADPDCRVGRQCEVGAGIRSHLFGCGHHVAQPDRGGGESGACFVGRQPGQLARCRLGGRWAGRRRDARAAVGGRHGARRARGRGCGPVLRLLRRGGGGGVHGAAFRGCIRGGCGKASRGRASRVRGGADA